MRIKYLMKKRKRSKKFLNGKHLKCVIKPTKNK
jgi:hypothetical protein